MEDIENAMVSGNGFHEPKPDRVCPHCGTEWYSGEDNVSLYFSASGQYCQHCLHELDTPENRAAWLKNDGLEGDLLHNLAAYNAEEAADVLFQALRAYAPDVLDEWTQEFLEDRRSSYNEYLKEVS